MVRAGHVLRRVGAAALANGLAPSDNVRITLTHYVGPGDEENFGG